MLTFKEANLGCWQWKIEKNFIHNTKFKLLWC